MDVDDLKLVLLVAEKGSLAEAARTLNVHPSSVSRSLASVEAALGARLFQRSTRRLAPTEAGAAYLARLRPLLDEFDRAASELGAATGAVTGTLRIAASVAFGQVCLLPHIGRFRDAHPDLVVELLLSDANVDLRGEGIDLAIRLAPAPTGDLISSRLLRTRYRVCASPDYLAQSGALRSPIDLAARNCLRTLLPGYRDRWIFRDASGDEQTIEIHGNLLIGSALAYREAARLGLGPALLADWLVADDLRSGRLVDLFPDHAVTATDFDTGAWFLYPSRSFLPAKVRVAIDFFRACLRATGD